MGKFQKIAFSDPTFSFLFSSVFVMNFRSRATTEPAGRASPPGLSGPAEQSEAEPLRADFVGAFPKVSPCDEGAGRTPAGPDAKRGATKM